MTGANSVYDISYNNVSADNLSPLEMNPSACGWSRRPLWACRALSKFSIHDNNIMVRDACGCDMWGMWLLDAVGGLPSLAGLG
jgi:hypothetical protein